MTGNGAGFFSLWDRPNALVASGEGRTDEQGNLVIAFDSHSGETPLKYTISATVRDATSMTATGSAEIEDFPSPYRVTVGTTRLFYEAGEQIDARVRVESHDGQAQADHPLKLTAFMQVDDSLTGATEFGSFFTEPLRTDPNGLAVARFISRESGRLRLRVEADTPQGNKSVARRDLLIVGPAAVRQGPDFEWGGGSEGEVDFGRTDTRKDRSLHIKLDTDLLAYSPGETVRLMVRASRTPLVALLLIEGDELYSTKVIQLSKHCEVLELPVNRDMPSRARVSVLAWPGPVVISIGVVRNS
ncbi:MAG: hypothetical protein ABGZ35_29440 [Planctomycetaceae bacterium]